MDDYVNDENAVKNLLVQLYKYFTTVLLQFHIPYSSWPVQLEGFHLSHGVYESLILSFSSHWNLLCNLCLYVKQK